MMAEISDDRLMVRLRSLPRAAPRVSSSARIRTRSHAVLNARRKPERANGRLAARVVDGLFVLISVVYLSGAAAQAWRLFAAIR
jgi:hypothetical protein